MAGPSLPAWRSCGRPRGRISLRHDAADHGPSRRRARTADILYTPSIRGLERFNSTAAAIIGLIVAGCATPPTATTTDPAAPFTETIQGTALVSLEMVPVPGADLWVSRHEITWDLYDVFIYGLDTPAGDIPADVAAITRPSKPYISMDRGYGHAGYPAISMSYRGAEAFCAWLSARTGRRYRLPTEAEWGRLCFQADVAPESIDAHAWGRDNAGGTTHPVGSKRPDALGLHDLLGNAAEWCTGRDGSPVTLGGSHRDPLAALGCAAREAPVPAWNASDPQFPKSTWWLADAGFVGFRVVCEP